MTKQGKQKGRLGQQEIRDKLLETFPEFEEFFSMCKKARENV